MTKRSDSDVLVLQRLFNLYMPSVVALDYLLTGSRTLMVELCFLQLKDPTKHKVSDIAICDMLENI